jgi:hypothetical protein
VGADGVKMPEGSNTPSARGKDGSVPPGSESEARVRKGLPRNLGDLFTSCVSIRAGHPVTKDQAAGRFRLQLPVERTKQPGIGTGG